MDKIILYTLMAFVLVMLVSADDILVLDFTYDNGGITLNDKALKTGYMPDRKISPADGYKLVEISSSDEVLYSFTFAIPLIIYTDSSEFGKVAGNMIVLNKTAFSLVVPSYDNLKTILILDKGQREVARLEETPKLSPPNPMFLTVFLLVIGILCLLYAFTHIRKQKKK
jgi:hypothetical protein